MNENPQAWKKEKVKKWKKVGKNEETNKKTWIEEDKGQKKEKQKKHSN